MELKSGRVREAIEATVLRLTHDGKATALRNACKGGHWLMLRELSRLVNAEIRAGRDLVDAIRR